MPKKKPAKPNPEPVEMITVTLPKDLPKGLEYRHTLDGGSWVMKNKKAVHHLFDLIEKGIV